MNLPREDAICPACPDPTTAFTITDVGLKTDSGPDPDTFKITASRRLMLEHLRVTDDDAHQQRYADLTALLTERGQTAEQAARADIQSYVDHAKRSLTAMLDVARDLDDWAIPDLRPPGTGTQPGLANLKTKLDNAMRESAQPARLATLPGSCGCRP